MNLGYIECTKFIWCNKHRRSSCKKFKIYARFVLDMLVHAVFCPSMQW